MTEQIKKEMSAVTDNNATAKSSGIGREIDKYNSPYNGNNHDAKRNPDRAFRHNIAGKLLQDSCEHR